MTGHTSESMPARPGCTPPPAQPPVTGLRIAGLPRAAGDENTAVDSLLDGVDRLRVARQARVELATVSAGDLRASLVRQRAGRGGGPS